MKITLPESRSTNRWASINLLNLDNKAMKRTLAVFLGFILLTSLNTHISHAAVKAGATCNKANAKQTYLGKKYICIKTGKKLKWRLVPNSVKVPTPPKVDEVTPPPVVEKAEPVDSTPDPVVSDKSFYINSAECKLTYTSPDADQYLGFPRGSRYPTSLGERKSIVLFVDFSDKEAEPRAMEVWKNKQIPVAENIFGALSYGKYKIKFDVNEKIYRLAGSYKDYTRNEYVNAAGSTPALGLEYGKFVSEAVKIADLDVDFSKYDFVNVVTPTFTPKAEGGATGGGGFSIDGKSSFLATVGPIDEYLDDANKDNWLTHEVGHILGLTHIYNYSAGTLGAWDFMGNSFGFNELHGWQRWFLGWIEDSQVLCLDQSSLKETIQLISPLGEANDNVKSTIVKLSPTTALVIEVVRSSATTKLSTANEGVLVYKIDTKIPGGKGSISIISKPGKIQPTKGGRGAVIGTMVAGESMQAEGFTIKVLKSSKDGDYISISKG
jgi:M6 family metalloprotease-like protein